ncbi:MAG: HD-GYP domain-containing protein, partial [Candidatus Dormibacteraeota bacterium]|nr:HD-GYP domain-containing protein [Candidatus Dormibacteraeota bacterium]
RGRFLPEIAEILRHHHERWDGGGTPDGFTGDEIPLLARVLNVAENFERMTSSGGAPAEVLDRITADAGTVFDPAVVDALARLVGDGERLASMMRSRPQENRRAADLVART